MMFANLLLVLLLQEEWYEVPDAGVMGQASIKQNQMKLSQNSLASLFNMYGKRSLE